MSLTIQIKKESSCKNHKFCIYHHTLSMDELDSYILQIMFDETNLHQLFEPNQAFEPQKRLNQLRRFIETGFKNREEEITNGDIKNRIKNNTNPSYFSFFAEALLARLNIDLIDNKLATGVISVTETIKDGKTGADVCMFSDESLVLGEAKFYGGLSRGLTSIIDDSSFKSKLESYCNKIIASDCEIIIKDITGDVKEKSAEEIKQMSFTFTGFVLHTKSMRDNYETHYEKISTVAITDMPSQFKICLYHLPVKSKEKLIFKVQRTALELIIKLKSS
jgi:hypothetical protein